MRLFSLFLLMCLVVLTDAQSIRYVFEDCNIPSKDRYQDIEGSPYYYSKWVKGSILRSDAKTLEDVLLNYNGYTRELEARHDTVTYSLAPSWHIRAEVSPRDNPGMEKEIGGNIAFQHNLDPEFGDAYAIILFHGDHYMLLKKFDVNRTKDTRTEFAASNPKQYFTQLGTYYIRKDGKLEKLKTQKKKLEEALGNDKRIMEYLSANNLDLREERDLVRLVSYANTIASE